MGKEFKQLGQTNPANTNFATIYSLPDSNTTTIIDKIIVANVDSSNHTFRINHDADGTDETTGTRLFHDNSISANTTTVIDGPFYMRNSSGTFKVRSSTANAITFTVYGREIDGITINDDQTD